MLPRFLIQIYFLLMGIPVLSQEGSAGRTYAIQELRSDLAFLKERLERIHPDLYMYISKPELDHVFDSLAESIDAPLTEPQFFDRVSYLHSRIRDGHTMFLPSEAMMDNESKKLVFLPLRVALVNGRMYVRENHSSDPSLRKGAEVTSLNGLSTAEVIEHLRSRQIRDGYNETYPTWILDRYFRNYYSFSFGHPRQFTLGLREDGMERQISMRALSWDSIMFYRTLRGLDDVNADLRTLEISQSSDTAEGYATLVIPKLDNSTWRYKGAQKEKRDWDAYFERLSKQHIRHLIIDLRNDQGGDFEPGRRLLTYLIDGPLSFLPGSSEAATLQPSRYAFKGKIHVLINGGSFSITGIVCAYLRQTGRADFIGEETAGNRMVICGSPKSVTLPATGIQAEISTRKYVILPGPNTGHGTLPDHPVLPTIEDILQGRDPAMEVAVGLVN